MKQRRYFVQQFADVSAGKLARRERFLRKVAGRKGHLRTGFKRSKRLLPARAKG